MGKSKTHCKHGHLFSDDNVYIDPRGKRQCRSCRANSQKKQILEDGTSYRKKHKRLSPWPDRFWENVEIEDGGCWLWDGHKTIEGYGVYSRKMAHRVAYELANGPGSLIDGLSIDHTCFNRSCVNPDHLEQVTQEENFNRSLLAGHLSGNGKHLADIKRALTHCRNGHPYSGENLRIEPCSGARRCRICDSEKAKRYNQKKSGVA